MAKTGLAMNKFSPRVVLTQQAAVRHRGESHSFHYSQPLLSNGEGITYEGFEIIEFISKD